MASRFFMPHLLQPNRYTPKIANLAPFAPLSLSALLDLSSGRILLGTEGGAIPLEFCLKAEADMASAKLAALGPLTRVQRMVARFRLEAAFKVFPSCC